MINTAPAVANSTDSFAGPMASAFVRYAGAHRQVVRRQAGETSRLRTGEPNGRQHQPEPPEDPSGGARHPEPRVFGSGERPGLPLPADSSGRRRREEPRTDNIINSVTFKVQSMPRWRGQQGRLLRAVWASVTPAVHGAEASSPSSRGELARQIVKLSVKLSRKRRQTKGSGLGAQGYR